MFIRALDTHLLNGSIQHRQLGYLLLFNFVVNNESDVLIIVNDTGIMMRIIDGIAQRRDSSATFEANNVLYYIIKAVA